MKTRKAQGTQNILTLGDFKMGASGVLKSINKNGRPVIITQNGKPAGVLISPEEFDRYREREDFVAAVAEGRQASSLGNTRDLKEVESLIDKRFGKMK